VFADANEACAAAQEAYLQLKEKGVAARRKIEEVVKTLAEKNAEAWGRLELDETKIGRLDHKNRENSRSSSSFPGVDWLRPDARSGRSRHHAGGIHAVRRHRRGDAQHAFDSHDERQHREHCRRRKTRSCSMRIRARRAPMRRPPPCAPTTRRFTARPALKTSRASSRNRRWTALPRFANTKAVRLLLVTGGPMVVKGAMQTGKRAICAGPGNPPVFVDDNRVPETRGQGPSLKARRLTIICSASERRKCSPSKASRTRSWPKWKRTARCGLTNAQLDALTKAAFTFKEGQGGGCAHAAVNKEFHRQRPVCAGEKRRAWTFHRTRNCSFAETDAKHPFVEEEQMMPFLPIVRVKSVRGRHRMFAGSRARLQAHEHHSFA